MLITALKDDYILALTENFNYTPEEAEQSWEDNGDWYLEKIFDEISIRIMDCVEENK